MVLWIGGEKAEVRTDRARKPMGQLRGHSLAKWGEEEDTETRK